LKKKNKTNSGRFLRSPSGPAQPSGPLAHPRPRSPVRPSSGRARARGSLSLSFTNSLAPPVIPHLCLPRSLPRAQSCPRGGRPASIASVTQPSGSIASTQPSEPILLTYSSTRALVTHYRRRWRHGGHGTQHAGANTTVETKLRVRGASVAHRGCSGALGGDGRGRVGLATGRRGWRSIAGGGHGSRRCGGSGEKKANSGGSRDARGRGDSIGAVCVAGGGLTAASGERRSCAAAVAKTGKKKTSH
jgi:hypothetical protein